MWTRGRSSPFRRRARRCCHWPRSWRAATWSASRSAATGCYPCCALRGSSPRRPRRRCTCGCPSPTGSSPRRSRAARSRRPAWWQIDRHQRLITFRPPQGPQFHELPPFGGTRRGIGPSGGLGRPLPNAAVPDTTPPAPAPVGRPDTMLATSADAVGPHIVTPPQVGDGRLWVTPRPALPSEVADALYQPLADRDTAVVRRLHAMVDSLNVIIDQ